MSAQSNITYGAIPPWTLTDRLIKARTFARLEQQDIADYLGLARSAIGHFEQGRRVPRLAYLRGWAQRCEVDFDWLVTGEAPEAPGPDLGGPSTYRDEERFVRPDLALAS